METAMSSGQSSLCTLCQQLGFPPDLNWHPDDDARYFHAGKHLMHDWLCLPSPQTKGRQMELCRTCFGPAPPQTKPQKRSFEKTASVSNEDQSASVSDHRACASMKTRLSLQKPKEQSSKCKMNLRAKPKKDYVELSMGDEVSDKENERDEPPMKRRSNYSQKPSTAEIEWSVGEIDDSGPIPAETENKDSLPVESEERTEQPNRVEEIYDRKIEEKQPVKNEKLEKREKMRLKCNLCGSQLPNNTEIAQWEHASGYHLQTKLFLCGKAACGWRSHRVSHMKDHIKYTHNKELKRFQANEDVKKLLGISYKEKGLSTNKEKDEKTPSNRQLTNCQEPSSTAKNEAFVGKTERPAEMDTNLVQEGGQEALQDQQQVETKELGKDLLYAKKLFKIPVVIKKPERKIKGGIQEVEQNKETLPLETKEPTEEVVEVEENSGQKFMDSEEIQDTKELAQSQHEAKDEDSKQLKTCSKEVKPRNRCKLCGFQCREGPSRRRREKWLHVVGFHLRTNVVFCQICQAGFNWGTTALAHIRKEHPNVENARDEILDKRSLYEALFTQCFGEAGMRKKKKSDDLKEKRTQAEKAPQVQRAVEITKAGNESQGSSESVSLGVGPSAVDNSHNSFGKKKFDLDRWTFVWASGELENKAEKKGLEEMNGQLERVLEEIKGSQGAKPFLCPFHGPFSQRYLKIIRKPMDLETVERKLAEREYKDKSEFVDDFNLIFLNCLAFNGLDSQRTKMALKLELDLIQAWKKHFPFPAEDEGHWSRCGLGALHHKIKMMQKTELSMMRSELRQDGQHCSRNKPLTALTQEPLAQPPSLDKAADDDSSNQNSSPPPPTLTRLANIVTLKRKGPSSTSAQSSLTQSTNAENQRFDPSRESRAELGAQASSSEGSDDEMVDVDKVESDEGTGFEKMHRQLQKVLGEVQLCFDQQTSCRTPISTPNNLQRAFQMDLNTVKKKVMDGDFYHHKLEFIADINVIFLKCLKYNGLESPCTKLAQKLELALIKAWNTHFPSPADEEEGNGCSRLEQLGALHHKITQLLPQQQAVQSSEQPNAISGLPAVPRKLHLYQIWGHNFFGIVREKPYLFVRGADGNFVLKYQLDPEQLLKRLRTLKTNKRQAIAELEKCARPRLLPQWSIDTS